MLCDRRERWLKHSFSHRAPLLLSALRAMGRNNQCRLLVDLVRSAQEEEVKSDLRAKLRQWLALRVVRMGWHRRLFGLTGNRLKMIKQYGRFNALRDSDDERTGAPRRRAPPRRRQPELQ